MKNDLLHSVVCTAVFGVVFGIIVACSGSHQLQNLTGNLGNAVIRLVDHVKPTMVAIPKNINSDRPFMAALFQAGQGSQLQQSFQGGGPCLQVPMPSSGYIPLILNDEAEIGSNKPGQGILICEGVFSQIGGGVDEISGQMLTNPGVPMFLSGTLTTLVATGRSVNGVQLRCSDLTTTFPVNDGDMVQPYFVIATNSVILGIGTNQLPFTCNLNVPSGDQIYYVDVQWAKI